MILNTNPGLDCEEILATILKSGHLQVNRRGETHYSYPGCKKW